MNFSTHAFRVFSALAALVACGSWVDRTYSQDVEPVYVGRVELLEEELGQLIDPTEVCEVLASGFRWSEGPVWLPKENALLFSDVPQSMIHRWSVAKPEAVFMKESGSKQDGSNGLVLDAKGRLTVCDHGHRRVYRLEADGTKVTLADRFNGKRFNSPNDLVFHSNGDLYFTDPPYGLKDESLRELGWHGVYRLRPDRTVDLLTKELTRPNGIGLSPDGRTLYVAQSEPKKAIYVAYPLEDDGTVGAGKVLYDATRWVESDPGLPDGMAIDEQGNLWATGPGGVLIMTPSGKLLGRIMTGRATANCTFGENGSTLFMTAGSLLLRIPTKVRGLSFMQVRAASGGAATE